ncbi:23S rRNA (cytosine1962-C5)-methyltransferase [Anaerobacterium chartisolvens]|uniref:23S rRNA (Cytosine1962-C5)-methyltransferase n=1 Tax=Anaerobacterium chartisolvens TaxID=1297424 RepID=A0A369B7W0_9FIRM|nr:class I SAM-dependent methyltransferase [Anaerobacterium chartisolvens]RCX17613.1 23S rRNA (cytosine1962-C5)-methyltransferase [Anaerobacterium chartisolvens]
MLLADDWKDYELIDTGEGEKLERWGTYVLRRPDPQVIWPAADIEGDRWRKADARYLRSSSGGGHWEYRTRLPRRWNISYGGLKFYVEPTGFKHTGLFPEQAANWKWMMEKIRSSGEKVRVLNLFAYTGGATAAAAYAGAEVCHVDASKGMVSKAKENLLLSGLGERPVRYITDDAVKFVEREKRRGNCYEAVIMDPPSYGRGPGGELWKIEDELYRLVELCAGVLCAKPLFFLINSYTTGLAPTVLSNVLKLTVARRFGGRIESDEVGLPVASGGLVLPCGASGRWEA